jgi:Na+/H+ antiporter NhaC
MKAAEVRTSRGKLFNEGSQPLISSEMTGLKAKSGIPLRARNLILPVLVLVLMMPITLYITGKGNLMNGSGSSAVFWAVLTAIFACFILYRMQGLLKINEMIDLSFRGMGELLPLALIVVLAFCLGNICKELGTGIYASNVAKEWLTPKLLPAILFLIGCFISFATGTSWGTFATLIPIGVPMAEAMGVNLHLVIGAILSGGVFGDHCSPLSDTTIVSAMASASDLMDHTKTQLPYGLLAAGISFVLFLLFGFL